MKNCVTVGNGPKKILVLHGWFGHSGGWGPFVDALDTTAATWAFVDYRGYGTAKHRTGTYTTAEIAADALSAADHLFWDQFSVVGHSMGGMAALKVLAEAPSRVERVVGINPVPPSGYPFDDNTWAFFQSAAENPEARYGILNLTTGSRLTPVFLRKLLTSNLESSTVPAFAGYLLAWGKENFADSLTGLKQPIHLMVGEHDPAVPVALLENTTRKILPQSTMEVLPNAGHYAMFETPVFLATRLNQLLL